MQCVLQPSSETLRSYANCIITAKSRSHQGYSAFTLQAFLKLHRTTQPSNFFVSFTTNQAYIVLQPVTMYLFTALTVVTSKTNFIILYEIPCPLNFPCPRLLCDIQTTITNLTDDKPISVCQCYVAWQPFKHLKPSGCYRYHQV